MRYKRIYVRVIAERVKRLLSSCSRVLKKEAFKTYVL
jgi:hypothetical protein